MIKQITLLADIGATNARFALSVGKTELQSIEVLQCTDFTTVEDAIDCYLRSHGVSKIDSICFAVAGPVIQGVVKVTNNHWLLDSAQLSKKYQLLDVSLLNDFESVAYSVTQLSKQELMPIGKQALSKKQASSFTYVILGPGTGLGVAALVNRNNKTIPIVTEGGHASFAPINEIQLAILNCLRKKYKQVSNELLLSGAGIVNIYQALCEIHHEKVRFEDAAQIGLAAEHAEDQLCIQSLQVFFEVLGQVAGDLALTFAAFDGVYVAGGIVPRYQNMIEDSRFRAGFENKSQHRELLENTPTYLVTATHPGLIGAQYFANSKL
jgi:glucokinase